MEFVHFCHSCFFIPVVQLNAKAFFLGFVKTSFFLHEVVVVITMGLWAWSGFLAICGIYGERTKKYLMLIVGIYVGIQMVVASLTGTKDIIDTVFQ